MTTIQLYVSVATVFAILGISGSAAAQPFSGQGAGGTAPTYEPACGSPEECTKECLVECNTRIVPCASSPTDVMMACGDIPACTFMSTSYIEVINMTCDRCRAGERNCAGGTSDAAPPAPAPAPAATGSLFPWLMPSTPPPIVVPKPAVPAAAPAPKSLTKEQLCKQQGGIMAGTACWKLEHAKKEIEKLQSDLGALTKRVDGQGQAHSQKLKDELKKINDRLTAIEGALKQQPSEGTPLKNNETPQELSRRITAAQKMVDDLFLKNIKDLSNRDTQQDKILKEHGAEIKEIKDRVSSVFGFELNAAVEIDALRPYGNTICGVMPQFLWLPAFSEDWRLELGGGYGYAGKLDGETLRVGTVMVGMIPHVAGPFHLGFGVDGEWRTDPSEHTRYSSYGAYIEPKICPGDDTPQSDEVPLTTPPHYFCFGARVSFMGTIFQHPISGPEDPPDPHSGETYTRPDANFLFFVGYAFLPKW